VRRVLLTGKNGQVGWELQRTLATLGEVVALGRETMDLGDPDSIRSTVREVRPDLIVNAAAYTAVDKAESEAELAMAVNGVAPGILAEEAKRLNAAVVHYSTDYVFDGTKPTPYTEEDPPNPLNTYGRTKLAGEQAIQAIGAPHFILRTSWVYSTRGTNFLLTILRLAKEKEQLTIVDDQISAPTWSRVIAEATAQLQTEVGNKSAVLAEHTGVYHLSAAGETSWYGFAKEILEKAKALTDFKVKSLRPISTEGYPLPAQRPRYSAMSSARIEQTFGLAIPPWQRMLDLCMQEMGDG